VDLLAALIYLGLLGAWLWAYLGWQRAAAGWRKALNGWKAAELELAELSDEFDDQMGDR